MRPSSRSAWLLGASLCLSTLLLRGAADKKLAIARPVFAQSEDGPALAANYEAVPGESLFFSCLIEGYSKSEKDEIQLTYQIQAKDSRGVLLQEPTAGKVEATLAPEDKDWKPKLRSTIVVPPMADTGEYQVLIKVTDERNKSTAESRATFTVHGRDIAPSDTLVVRDFRFLRSEDDARALTVPAYRPGDSLWARFLMTGYKMGEGNSFDIAYGLVVLRPDGTVAYSQPEAAALQEHPFYPQRYQPGELSLNFPKDQPRGEFTIVLTVRDNIGKQTTETRQKFSIE